MRHLPRRLLIGQAEKSKRRKAATANRLEAAEDGDPAAEADVAAAHNRRDWLRKDPELVGSKVPAYVQPELSPDDQEKLDSLSTAYDYYKLYQSDSFVNEIVHQSRLYAMQKDFKKQAEMVSRDTYRCLEALLLHSGYHTVPRRNMLWELKPDCRNEMVANAIRRDEANAVLKCLHFRDNAGLDNDGYYKVRPLIDNLNRSAKWSLGGDQYSIDEVMIPYFGRHNTKQFIYGKPIRYGYKVMIIFCTPCRRNNFFGLFFLYLSQYNTLKVLQKL